MTALVACLLIFLAVSVFFVFFHLMLGKQIRPAKPDAEKLTIYECGEPTIGSSWIQFDLRFYVVALLFVIFDVEVAFFFPWAVVFGKANTLAKADLTPEQRVAVTRELVPPGTDKRDELLAALATDPAQQQQSSEVASKLALLSFLDIMVFFFVLLVGYAYLWKRGDLDWVRSTAAEKIEETAAEGAATLTEEPAVAGAARAG
jgi:NADH-quinone oxidoreductase subunit A